jgi:UDP-glucose:(glucosyl)LPS alpha-1,2-glucosyltransferase
MAFAHDSLAVNAKGGTEIMKTGLQKRLPPELLEKFQIYVSRVEEPFDETRLRIYWAHDLPGDPAADALKNNGWRNFHKLVFVSNWQMQAFINYYNIPWSKCVVLQNCITPIEDHEKPNDGTLRLAYWSTPHRGLNILVPVFDKLCEKYDNIELDVYSSFNLYGWAERDKQFEELFEQCRQHPKINYHGAIDNSELKQRLKNTHIMAYPSIWQETSCITLMEAMSAGLVSVHSNLGALYETSAGWSHMYQFHEDLNTHAHAFYQVLDGIIENYWDEGIQSRAQSARTYANVFYNWEFRKLQWEALLRSLLNEPLELPKDSGEMFVYRT